MPYTGRKESATKVYHVTGRGIGGENIFGQVREREQFLRTFKKFLESYQIEVYTYCIMSNHYHLIIKAEIQELSMFMSKVLAEYARYYNYKHFRKGYVFQSRFKSECIETERYYWNCVRYIHRNPEKANLVKKMESYKYSSIHEYRTLQTTIIHENALKMYEAKFGEWEHFLKFHQILSKQIFLDVESDLDMQLKEWAQIMLWEIQQENQLSTSQEVLENKELRKLYQERLKENLKLSIPKQKKLYEDIRQEVTENVKKK